VTICRHAGPLFGHIGQEHAVPGMTKAKIPYRKRASLLFRKITASREKAPDDAGALMPGFGLN
jgi:hypothetical protein